MKPVHFLLAMLAVIHAATAAEPEIRHRLLVAEYGAGGNRLIEVSPDGKLAWEHRPPSTMVIFEVPPKGEILYAFGGNPTGVRIIDHDQKVVWETISPCPQVLGASRTESGNILIGEQGPARALEMTREKEVVQKIPLTTSEAHFHWQVRNLHRLKNGNVLACHEAEGAVREVRPDGTIAWEFRGLADVFEALRLDNGNTLISAGTQKRIVEVDPSGKIVWEFGAKDAPELNLTWITSLQPLRNGHLVVGNFLRGQEGKGAHAFEVTRDKKVVWKWADHQMVKSLTTVKVIGE